MANYGSGQGLARLISRSRNLGRRTGYTQNKNNSFNARQEAFRRSSQSNQQASVSNPNTQAPTPEEILAADPDIVASGKNPSQYIDRFGNRVTPIASYQTPFTPASGNVNDSAGLFTKKQVAPTQTTYFVQPKPKFSYDKNKPFKQNALGFQEAYVPPVKDYGYDSRFRTPPSLMREGTGFESNIVKKDSFDGNDFLRNAPLLPGGVSLNRATQYSNILNTVVQKKSAELKQNNLSGAYSRAKPSRFSYLSPVGGVTNIAAGFLEGYNNAPIKKTVELLPIFYGSKLVGKVGGSLLGALETRSPRLAQAAVLVAEGKFAYLTGREVVKAYKDPRDFGRNLPELAAGLAGFPRGLSSSSVSPYLIPSANALVTNRLPIPSYSKLTFVQSKGGKLQPESTFTTETLLIGFRKGAKDYPLIARDVTGTYFGKNKISTALAERGLSQGDFARNTEVGYIGAGKMGRSVLELAGIKAGGNTPLARIRVNEGFDILTTGFKESGKVKAAIKKPSTKTKYLSEKELATFFKTAKKRDDSGFGSLFRTSYGVKKPKGELSSDVDLLAKNADELAAKKISQTYIANARLTGAELLLGKKEGSIERIVPGKGRVKVAEIKGGEFKDEYLQPSDYTLGYSKNFPLRRPAKDYPKQTDLPQEIRNLGDNIATLKFARVNGKLGADLAPFSRRGKDVSSYFQSLQKSSSNAPNNKLLGDNVKNFKSAYKDILGTNRRGRASAERPSPTPRSDVSRLISSSGASTLLSGSPNAISLFSPSPSPSRSPSPFSLSPIKSPSPSRSPSPFSLSPIKSPSPSRSPSPSPSPSRSPSPSPSIDPPSFGDGFGLNGFGSPRGSIRKSKQKLINLPSLTAAVFNLRQKGSKISQGTFYGNSFRLLPTKNILKSKKYKKVKL